MEPIQLLGAVLCRPGLELKSNAPRVLRNAFINASDLDTEIGTLDLKWRSHGGMARKKFECFGVLETALLSGSTFSRSWRTIWRKPSLISGRTILREGLQVSGCDHVDVRRSIQLDFKLESLRLEEIETVACAGLVVELMRLYTHRRCQRVVLILDRRMEGFQVQRHRGDGGYD